MLLQHITTSHNKSLFSEILQSQTMLAALRSLAEEKNGDDILHNRNNDLIPASGPFSAEELAVQPLIAQIKGELKRIFSTLHDSACGAGQIIYNNTLSCGEGDRADDVNFMTSRPDVGDGTIYLSITKDNRNDARRIKCRFAKMGIRKEADGYLRTITTPQMVYTANLQQHADGTSDHEQIAALCSEIMKLRDVEFVDTQIAPFTA
jgi:hypothetical protein